MKLPATLLASAFSVWATGDALAAPPPSATDARELTTMRIRSPHALELLEKGEALAAAGDTKGAEALFQQSHTEDPDVSIGWRRDCQTLIALGQRSEAIMACSTAVAVARTDANERAVISALVDGPAAPTATQLSEALTITAMQRERGMGLTAAAAACDIAERMGDEVMLQGCALELERMAPDDPATQDARARLAARCPPWRFWAGWGAILAAVVATLGDALARRTRRRSAGSRVVAAAVLALALGSWTGVARADDAKPSAGHWLSKWPVDDDNPDANIPTEDQRNGDPLQFGYWLQDVALKGEHASKRGNHAAAARFYDTLSKAVPDRAIGFVKACQEYQAAGNLDAAIQRCGDALLRDGLRVQDYTLFVHLVVGKPGKLSEKEVGALAQVLDHMREDPAGRGVVDDLECEVGARTQNVAQLKECTAALLARDPNDARTIPYLWTLAVASGDSAEADKLLQKAMDAGLPPADIAKMKRAAADSAMRRATRTVSLFLAIALFLTGLVVAIRTLVARRRPAAGEALLPATDVASHTSTSEPPPADATG